MALQWMILTYVVAAEAAIKSTIVSLVSLVLQPALFIVPFAGFQLLDIYWKNEHRLMCTFEICTASVRDCFEKTRWISIPFSNSPLLRCHRPFHFFCSTRSPRHCTFIWKCLHGVKGTTHGLMEWLLTRIGHHQHQMAQKKVSCTGLVLLVRIHSCFCGIYQWTRS